MKKLLTLLLGLCLLFTCATAETPETAIVLTDGAITVNGEAISEDPAFPVHLALVSETHEDVPKELADLQNRVITITASGNYRISGTAMDTQIAVKAGESDSVRLILNGVNITCRTAPAIAIYSAQDTRTPGEYGVTIELADGSKNIITGSHTSAEEDGAIEFDGAIGSQVSLGFEGTGSLTVDADNEGVEVAYGHLTINGGVFSIAACDDPLNVSEDGVGTLTMNGGYVYSAVKPLEGGEGDGIDSNGYIVFNGGTAINLAHPTSQDGGIDSDMGSTINGGVIVGAGNMYDPIDEASQQLFMMLEFGESTDQLVVVTDENDTPVFAYDFPHDYMYIAFSTPALEEGKTYRVYLGGEIEGEAQNGLYTSIASYTPGTRMQHGAGNAQQRGFGMPGEMTEGIKPPEGFDFSKLPEMPEGMQPLEGFEPGEAPEMPEGRERGERREMPENWDRGERPELPEGLDFGDMPQPPEGGFGGFGGPRGMQSSADVATTDFVLTRESTGFTNVTAVSAQP